MASLEKPKSQLSREVLPPQKPHSGVGVMVVAAAAMFFAVASSALILQARMATDYCSIDRTDPQPPPLPLVVGVPSQPSTVAISEGACGTPIYEKLADGTISVTYRACPATPRGIEVGRIQLPAELSAQ